MIPGWILAPVGALALLVGLVAGGLAHMPEIGGSIGALGALLLIAGTAVPAIENRKKRK